MSWIEANTFNLKDLERLAVLRAVEYTKGNIQYARELLNVSKQTMYVLLRKHNIDYNAIRNRNGWRHTGWRIKKDL